MRILIHMGDEYPDEGPNAKRMRTFYESFKEKGHEVFVLAPTYKKKSEMPADVFYCKTRPLKNKSSLNRLLNQIGFGVSSFFRSFHIGKIDVVISTAPPPLISPFGWLISKCKRAKLVYDVRDIWPDVAWEMGSFGQDSLYSRIFEFIRNFMLKHSNLVTTVSKGKTEKLQRYMPETPVITIPNGLDLKFLENSENESLIQKYQLDQKFTCVYVGNLGLAQGLMQLLNIAKLAEIKDLNVQFLLFGSGVEKKKLQKYTEDNHLKNVQFPGKLPNADMYTILKHAKMSFVSLVNENLKDSVPTKMFEALGVGCPILLAAVGDAVDVLEECRLGKAVAPNDGEALWDAFTEIYNNLDEILYYKNYAQEIVRTKYSRQGAAMRLEEELTQRFL